ncbi:hypothetical protein DFH06DRAFT_1246126 [Mycena polygramma]|nr:hypothetical protein DFH06DRAFT_1246126 [Mycena polygramma]
MTTPSDSPPRLLRAQLEEVKSDIVQQRLERKKYLEAFKLRQHALNTKQHELETKLSLIVYPVLTLPPEITARFFVACLPDGCVRPCSKSAPLLLAQICHQWREIAISTPELWASPAIRFDLRRRGAPPASDGNLHLLEKQAAVGQNTFILRKNTRDPLSVFSNVPFLSELRIAHEPSHWNMHCYPLLSRASLGHIHFHSVSNVLQACPRLLHLSARVRDVPEGFFQPPVLPAPQLQSLILEKSDSSLSTLPPLILPGLRQLELDMSDHAAFLWLPPVVSLHSPASFIGIRPRSAFGIHSLPAHYPNALIAENCS